MEIDTALVRKFQTLENLNALGDKVGYAFSHAGFGNMDYRSSLAEEVLGNRQRFAHAAGFSLDDLVMMDPTQHTDKAARVTGLYKGRGVFHQTPPIEQTDGLMTTEKGLVLGMFTADCAPIIVTNQSADFMALYHGSRPCVEKDMNSKMLTRIKETFGVNPSDLVVGIGPMDLEYSLHYLKTRYVSKWMDHLSTPSGEKPEQIEATDMPSIKKISSSQGKIKMNVDLAGFIVEELTDLGVLAHNISVSNFSTHSFALAGELFSHQVSTEFQNDPEKLKQFPDFRFMTAVWLKPRP